MLHFLQNLFTDKLNNAIREPVFTFSLPGIEGKFALLGSPLSFWLQLFILLLGQSVLCVMIGSIVYTFIIQKRGTVLAYLVGYGVVIPFVIIMPFYVIPYLELYNMILMMCIASTPTLVIFRCKEAMYGTSPSVVEKDILTYCRYYSSVLPFRYDIKKQAPLKATASEIRSMLRSWLVNLLLTALTYSVMLSYDYSPFSSPRAIGESLASPIYLFHWGSLLNNFAVACLTSLALEGGTLGVGLGITLLSGNSTETNMRSPILESGSPSDFWGRRWNLLIHGLLKRGVYIPLRTNNVSKPLAALVTFFVSGLLHEYVLTVIALKGHVVSDGYEPYRPAYGMHFAFFLWNGLVMLGEYELQDSKLISKLKEVLPRRVITALVLLTVIPVSHWFTDEFVTSGYYTDYSFSLPVVVYMNDNNIQ